MEGDKEFISNLVNITNDITYIFRPDYEGQNLKNNLNFKKFKESIIKYGNNSKIFYCKIDKIYFCYNDTQFTIQGTCPICKRNICYFCSTINWYENCCLKCKIYHLLKIDAFIFFDSYPNRYYNIKINDFLVYALVPYLNCLFFFGVCMLIFINQD